LQAAHEAAGVAGVRQPSDGRELACGERLVGGEEDGFDGGELGVAGQGAVGVQGWM